MRLCISMPLIHIYHFLSDTFICLFIFHFISSLFSFLYTVHNCVFNNVFISCATFSLTLIFLPLFSKVCTPIFYLLLPYYSIPKLLYLSFVLLFYRSCCYIVLKNHSYISVTIFFCFKISDA